MASTPPNPRPRPTPSPDPSHDLTIAVGPELAATLADLRTTVRSGAFVLVTLTDGSLPAAEARIVEDEGVTHVVERDLADDRGWAYDYVAGWITLEVVSDLHLVGLTAVVSAALAAHGISCNVLAGRHHDHLLVPLDRVDDALLALDALRRPHTEP